MMKAMLDLRGVTAVRENRYDVRTPCEGNSCVKFSTRASLSKSYKKLAPAIARTALIQHTSTLVPNDPVCL